jgi:RNA polymerase sigma-70 factor (family 1)
MGVHPYFLNIFLFFIKIALKNIFFILASPIMLKVLKSDSDLWEDIRNDNELSFEVLFDRYWARLYKIAFQRLNDQEQSMEIVHDVFVSLWNRRKELQINAFPNFLLTAIRYQLYSRAKAPKLAIAFKADLTDSVQSELNLADTSIRELELQRELGLYLDQLPKRCHEIFHLSRIEHLSNQEIADKLGVSKKSVENQLTVALKHLRIAFKNIAYIVLFFHLFF